MITKVKVTKSKANPAALIVFESKWKLVNKLIKPSCYLCDVENTNGKWVQLRKGGFQAKVNSSIDSVLHEIVLKHEKKNDVEEYSDNIDLLANIDL